MKKIRVVAAGGCDIDSLIEKIGEALYETQDSK